MLIGKILQIETKASPTIACYRVQTSLQVDKLVPLGSKLGDFRWTNFTNFFLENMFSQSVILALSGRLVSVRYQKRTKIFG